MNATSPVMTTRRADGRVAAGLSIIPGLGQVYTGQLRKAAYYLVMTVLLLGGSVLLLTRGIGWGQSLIASGSVSVALLLALGVILLFLTLLIAGLFLWGSAAVDAWTSAREIASQGAASPRRRYFRL